MRHRSHWLLPIIAVSSLILSGCPLRPTPDQAASQPPALAFALAPVAQEALIIDLRTNRIANRLAAGGVPSAVALTQQGRLALIGNETTNTIRAYRQQDYATYNYLGDISVGRAPEWIAVNAGGQEALVAVKGDSRLAVLDISSRQERPTVKELVPLAQAPIAVAYASDGQSGVAISERNAYRLTRSATGYTASPLTLPDRTNRRLTAVTFAGDRIAVADGGTSELLVISADGLAVQTVGLEHGGKADLPQALAANAQGTKVYVAAQGTNSVAVIDPATAKVLSHVALGGAELPAGMALSADGTRLYVSHRAGLQIAILETSPAVSQPDSLQKAFGLTPSAANQAPLDEIVVVQ